MVFRSENKEHTVKGILISAPSCAGKSHLLKRTSKHTRFSGTRIFEMDSLKYYEPDQLKAQLPEAKKNFEAWSHMQKNNTLLKRLHHNINTSNDQERIIKYTFVALCAAPENFITVLPYILRTTTSGVIFIELLESIFKMRLIHVVIIPSFFRYLINFTYRLEIMNFSYMKRMLRERDSFHSKRDTFDYVVEPSLFKSGQHSALKFFHQQLNLTSS